MEHTVWIFASLRSHLAYLEVSSLKGLSCELGHVVNGMLLGVEEVIFNPRAVEEPAEGGGEGSAQVVWRITPSG